MATGQRVDPFLAYNFLVELDGITRAAFTEVTGLEATTEAVDYREGGENGAVRKLPGLTSWANLVLSWGMTVDRELYDWHRRTVLGDVQRKNGSIVVLDRRGNEEARINFFGGWPSKVVWPNFNATSNQVAVEKMELVVEGVERV